MKKIKIICDTREHEGFGWSFGDIETEVRKLDTGDYTLAGFEGSLCIERKKSPSEVAINIGKDSVRFNKELERMRGIKHSFLLLEFSLNDALRFPEGSNIPKSKLSQVRIGGKFLVKTLASYKEKYNLEVFYCNSREGAIEKALELFKIVEGESLKNE